MTFVIREEDLEEDFLTHSGVKGMRWGVRKSADAPVRSSAEIAAAHARRMKLGKEVTLAVVAAAGSITVASLAGPLAGAAASAAIRTVINTASAAKAEITNEQELGVITRRANEITKDLNAENSVLEGLHKAATRIQ